MSYPHPLFHPCDPEGAVVNHPGLNAFAPISCILPEILVTIFSYIRDDEMPEYFKPYQRNKPSIAVPNRKTGLGWIVVTHVCSYWRDVAIRACSLWSYVPLTWNSDWMWTILTRSQSVPLSILQFAEGGDLTGDAIRAIHEHVSHIQCLHISTDPVTMETLFSKLLGPAPLLKTVILAVCDVDERLIVSRIPPALFDGNTLAVSRLALVNCVVPWDSPNFCNLVRNLTSLEITFPFDELLWSATDIAIPRSKMIPSLTQLLDLLRLSPRLEYLALDEILPKCPAKVHSHRDRDKAVSLPNLKVCRLIGDALDCAGVAMHIYPSHDAFLDLDVSSENDDQSEAEYAAIAAVLEDHISFRKHATPTLSQVEVDMDLGRSHISINSSVFHVSIDTIWNSRCDAFIRRCLASLHPPAPTTLLLRYSWSRLGAQPDLIHIFGTESMLNTTEMVLSQGNSLGFQNLCDALCERSKPDATSSSPEQAAQQGAFLIFPELRTLSLKQVLLDSLQGFNRAFVPCLRRAVALRKKFGNPIEKLELRDCRGVDRRWLEEFRSIPGLQIAFDDDTRKYNAL